MFSLSSSIFFCFVLCLEILTRMNCIGLLSCPLAFVWVTPMGPIVVNYSKLEGGRRMRLKYCPPVSLSAGLLWLGYIILQRLEILLGCAVQAAFFYSFLRLVSSLMPSGLGIVTLPRFFLLFSLNPISSIFTNMS